MEYAGYITVAVVAYLLGSIPTGYLAARTKGIDIRTVGSGNIGATNALRVLGKPAGIAVLVMDGLKGWIACRYAGPVIVPWIGLPPDQTTHDWLAIIAGLAAVAGHNYTCWLKFKGGKGIATSAGVLAALVPWALVVIFSVWVIVFAASRYVSLGSIAAAASLPLATWFLGYGQRMIIITSAMTALAIYKHRGNIHRLLNGTESRVGAKKPEGHPT